MTNDQNQNDKSVVVADQTGMQKQTGTGMGLVLGDAINNAQEVFGFKEKWIELGPQEAYVVNGMVKPFGPGASKLGREAGVLVLTPKELIWEDGQLHNNPYVVRNESGQIDQIHHRKVAIQMNAAGHIKYKDFIYSRSMTVLQARNSMKLLKDTELGKNAKRLGTREDVAAWNKESVESNDVGAPRWCYYQLPNNPYGACFNLNDPDSKILDFVSKNIELELNFTDATETKAERRSIWYVIPEAFIPATGDSAPVIIKDGDRDIVTSAWFKVIGPTKSGILLSMLQKLMIAMLSEDDEAVLSAKAAFANTIGMDAERINITEAGQPDPRHDPDQEPITVVPIPNSDVIKSAKAVDKIQTGEVQLDPPPKEINDIKDFQEYFMAQIPRLTDDEVALFESKGMKHVAKSHLEEDGSLKIENMVAGITMSNAPKFASAMRKVIKARETIGEIKPVTADEARIYVTELLTDGNNRAIAALENAGVEDGVSITDVSDEIVLKVYAELTAVK